MGQQVEIPDPGQKCILFLVMYSCLLKWILQLDQSAGVQKLGLAQLRSDKLHTGQGDVLDVKRYRNCQSGVPGEIYWNSVLQGQNSRLQERYPSNEWNYRRRRLKGWQGDKINFLEGAVQGKLPLFSPGEGLPVLSRVQKS